MTDWADDLIKAVFRKRAENGGRHLHHRDCIHNMPPEEQVTMRGRTVEWWTKVIGPLPTQITPEQWETDPPEIAACPSVDDPKSSQVNGTPPQEADRG